MAIELHHQPGRALNTPALHATVDPDLDLIEVRDGVGPLLTLSFDQAARLAADLTDILTVVRGVSS